MRSSRLLFLMCYRKTLSLIVIFSAVNFLFSVLGCQAEEKNKGEFLMSRNLADGLYASLNTDQGEIVVELFYEKTPITVANFVSLVEGSAGQSKKKGPFYDGLKFHRVVADFVIQGGDPLGNGTGGPGYLFQDEIVKELTFDKPGYLAMANSGPGTNGSQFFITLSSTPHLNGKHTIFGRVIADEDQEIVGRIKEGDTIKSISIGRQGDKAKGFDPDREKQIRSKVDQEMSTLHSGKWENHDGVFYVMKEKGFGDKPKSGDTVNIHYKGYFLDNQKVFDSSYERGEALTFNVGMKQVITGWDKTVLDMQVQEKRLIVLSPELAYGDKGAAGAIPPHSWLVFEMERIS